MLNIPVNPVRHLVNSSAFDVLVDVHCGLRICKYSYEIQAFFQQKRHRILITNCIKENPPLVYQDRERLLIVNCCSIFVVDLSAGYAQSLVELHYPVLRLDRLDFGYLACLDEGCVLISAADFAVVWRRHEYQVQDVIWRDGELRVFYDEHTSLRIDPVTGRDLNEASQNRPRIAANRPLPRHRFPVEIQDGVRSNVIVFPGRK